ncbi:MAG: PP2C family protein-serine/threonine phosphatase [Phycisphaerales bacterium]
MGDRGESSPRDARAAIEVAEVQRVLLPAELPSHPNWALASHYEPCDASGGDFYGFQEGLDGELLMLVADVSGHGARAAVVMAMLRAWLEALRTFERAAEDVPTDINRLLCRVSELGVFATGVFVKLDRNSGAVRYVNCGHPLPRVIRAQGSVELLTGGRCLPLGVRDQLGLQEPGDVQLHPGDSLVIFTDGITEAPNAHAELFDDARLDAALLKGGTPCEMVHRVLTSVRDFRQGAAREDDECMLVVQRR